MRQAVKIEGFVLKKRPLLNRDLIITLFTDKSGKVNVFGKGVKTITSRRSPHIETANLIKAILSIKNERLYLQETKLISGFSDIKKNRSKLNCLYIFLFVLEKLLPENQKEEKVYRIFKSFLIELTKKNENYLILTKYLNKILIALGYQAKSNNYEQIVAFLEDLINEKLPRFDI